MVDKEHNVGKNEYSLILEHFNDIEKTLEEKQK